MQIKNLALFAAALTSVSAEFAIFTVPLPKNLGDALGNVRLPITLPNP